MIQDPVGLAAILLAVPAMLFWLNENTPMKAVFSRVPVLIFAYFIPTILSNLGVIPQSSPVYKWVMAFILPASLLLLTLSVDIKGVLRLGPKALILFVTGTAGIVLGGPIALFLYGPWLPADIWTGMAALSGSWIGGGVNFIAIGKSVGATESMLGMMVFVDVMVGYTWTGILMYLATRSEAFDRRIGADTSAIDALKERVAAFQERSQRVTSTSDFMVLLAIALGGAWIAEQLSQILPPVGDFIGAFSWKVILITTAGIALSFTRFRDFEGAGASKLGTVFLYMLIGTIGAGADVGKIVEYPMLIAMAVTWMLIHAILLFTVAWLLKAPLFFVAVGSQANVGGVASAPVVASVFHPALASVGVLLGVLGYVMGTYAGLLSAWILRWIGQ
jgi:uncharacterized membrane protein